MNNSDWIDAYFAKTLSEFESLEFKKMLAEDESLREEFEFQKSLKAAITLNAREEVKKALQLENDKLSIRKPLWPKLTIAASIIILLGGTFFMLNKSNPTESLFTENYEVYPNVVAPTIRGNSDESTLALAFWAYDNFEYDQAAKLFTQLIENKYSDASIRFYRGLCYIEIQNTEAARKDFEHYIGNEKNQFYLEATWYLALINLKNGEKPEAIERLNRVSQSENDFQNQAADLLKKLK